MGLVTEKLLKFALLLRHAIIADRTYIYSSLSIFIASFLSTLHPIKFRRIPNILKFVNRQIAKSCHRTNGSCKIGVLLKTAFFPLKGNMDIEALESLLQEKAADVPLVMLTLTNNTGGGQPVSLENIHYVSTVCRQYKKPLYLDACR